MTLATRLLVGSLILVVVLVAGVVEIAGSRLQTRLADETRLELEREAPAAPDLELAGRDLARESLETMLEEVVKNA